MLRIFFYKTDHCGGWGGSKIAEIIRFDYFVILDLYFLKQLKLVGFEMHQTMGVKVQLLCFYINSE